MVWEYIRTDTTISHPHHALNAHLIGITTTDYGAPQHHPPMPPTKAMGAITQNRRGLPTATPLLTLWYSGVVQFGRAREQWHRLLGCIFWAKFGWRGDLIPWPNRDGRTKLDRLSRSKNQPYHNQPSGASLCSANWPWDGTAALFVATEIGGNIQRTRGVEGMGNW